MKHFNEYKYVLINENIHSTVSQIKKILEFENFLYNNDKNLKKNLKKIINS